MPSIFHRLVGCPSHQWHLMAFIVLSVQFMYITWVCIWMPSGLRLLLVWVHFQFDRQLLANNKLTWIWLNKRIIYLPIGCLHGQDPMYLADFCLPASDVTFRKYLHSASCRLLVTARCCLAMYGLWAMLLLTQLVKSLPDNLHISAVSFDCSECQHQTTTASSVLTILWWYALQIELLLTCSVWSTKFKIWRRVIHFIGRQIWPFCDEVIILCTPLSLKQQRSEYIRQITEVSSEEVLRCGMLLHSEWCVSVQQFQGQKNDSKKVWSS